jgi:hypothetical protein
MPDDDHDGDGGVDNDGLDEPYESEYFGKNDKGEAVALHELPPAFASDQVKDLHAKVGENEYAKKIVC